MARGESGNKSSFKRFIFDKLWFVFGLIWLINRKRFLMLGARLNILAPLI